MYTTIDYQKAQIAQQFARKLMKKPLHQWCVCLGIPYGTALWQVGDSSEQNRKFKMLLNHRKGVLFQQRLDNFTQKLHIMRSDIIPLVNFAWPQAFCDVEGNRKAIADRGWYPYNRVSNLNRRRLYFMTQSLIGFNLIHSSFPNIFRCYCGII